MYFVVVVVIAESLGVLENLQANKDTSVLCSQRKCKEQCDCIIFSAESDRVLHANNRKHSNHLNTFWKVKTHKFE